MRPEVLVQIGFQTFLFANQVTANAVLDMMRGAKIVEDYRYKPEPFIRVTGQVEPLTMALLPASVKFATAADMAYEPVAAAAAAVEDADEADE